MFALMANKLLHHYSLNIFSHTIDSLVSNRTDFSVSNIRHFMFFRNEICQFSKDIVLNASKIRVLVGRVFRT